MINLTHEQARQYILAGADDLLQEAEQQLLAEHLHSCADCQRYQAELEQLETRLRTTFQQHRESAPIPQRTHVPRIQAQQRRNIMNTRFASSLKFAFGAVLLTGLIVFVSTSLLKVKNAQVTPTVQAGIQTSSPEPQPTTLPPSPVTDHLLAFTSTASGNVDIYLVSTDGSAAINLTNSPEDEGLPIWSPNGTQIAFDREGASQREIHVLNVADGTSKVVLQDADNYSLLSWSPDSSQLLLLEEQQSNWYLYALQSDGSALISLLDQPLPEPATNTTAWSPDGKQIAYWRKQTLEVIQSNGENRRVLAEGEFSNAPGFLRWSEDGEYIYYSESNADTWKLMRAPSNGTSQGQILKTGSVSMDGTVVEYQPIDTGGIYYALNTSESIGGLFSGEFHWFYQDEQGKTRNIANWQPEKGCGEGGNLTASKISPKLGVIAFGAACQKTEDYSVNLVDVETGTIRKSASVPALGFVTQLDWSWDGQSIILMGFNLSAGQTEIYQFLPATDAFSLVWQSTSNKDTLSVPEIQPKPMLRIP